MSAPTDTDVYSLAEIAAAAGVSDAVVLDLAAHGCLPVVSARSGTTLAGLVGGADAVAAVRALACGAPVGRETRAVIAVAPTSSRPAGLPVLASTGLHAVGGLALAALVSLSWSLRAEQPMETVSHEPSRLVYLAEPGPGGGGGGGGVREKLAPPKAERQGDHSLNSPLPARELPPPAPVVAAIEPPAPLDARMLPPVMAPIATAPADTRSVEGVLKEAPPSPSQGPGAGGGAGTGSGTGLGEGRGAGLGDGSGGGMGGGPYRAGSGIDPPRLLREVKATYTDEARRQNLTGDVEMEITIRRDGTVSDVRVMRGLGGGLDGRAVAAVRQWRFAPARLRGTAVDVIVEVSVEFTLR